MSNLSNQSGKVAFFHVPKTGGITFRGVLQRMYEDSFIECQDPSLDAICENLRKFACVEFHVPLHSGNWAYTHSELANNNCWNVLNGREIFTMLRNPVEHIVSSYSYQLAARQFLEPHMFKPFGIPFPETLEEFVELPWYFNNQVHFLSGQISKPSFEFSQDDLAKVKDWLVELKVHVGLTERYADSLHVLEQVTGRKIRDNRIEKLNENPNRIPLDKIPNWLKDKICKQSALDLELYEFGKKLFEEEFKTCGESPSYTFTNGNPLIAKAPDSSNESSIEGKRSIGKFAHGPLRITHFRLSALGVRACSYLRRMKRTYLRDLPSQIAAGS